MSIFRRLSFMGGSSSGNGGGTGSISSTSSEEPRPPHRHRHSIYRNQKNYDISPTGGNRPISITADPRVSFSADTAEAPPPAAAEHRSSSHHRSRSETRERRVRKHKSRPDTTAAVDPPRKHSSRSSRKRRSVAEIDSDPVSPVSPIEVAAPPSVPIPVSAQAVYANRMSGSPPSSMGIVISRPRRGSSASSTPMITATPPTPSPLEQARRSNTHPTFPQFSLPAYNGKEPPPYPVSPPEFRYGDQYVAEAVSKLTIGMPEANSLLHRYRSNFDPLHGRAELSSEPEPVEIGSSDTSFFHPQRTDSGKSFNSTAATAAAATAAAAAAAPPPKSPAGISRGRGRGRGSLRENQYEFLRTFDTVFVIDDSASMAAFTRWPDTRSALETIATIATKYDSDGIDIHFLNHTHYDSRNITSAADVRRLFDLVQPAGITPIAACLDRILRGYLDTYAAARAAVLGQQQTPVSPVSPGGGFGMSQYRYPKPLNIIVLTDGEPTDDPESVIVDAARRLDALNAPLSQVGIQFFQIGDEEGAREALEDLDDALAEIYGIRDMVDYTPYLGHKQREQQQEEDGEPVTGEWILKVLTGAVNRRLDRLENDHGNRRGR